MFRPVFLVACCAEQWPKCVHACMWVYQFLSCQASRTPQQSPQSGKFCAFPVIWCWRNINGLIWKRSRILICPNIKKKKKKLEWAAGVAEFSKQHEVLRLSGRTRPSLSFKKKQTPRNARTHAETHWLAGFPVQMAGDDRLRHRSQAAPHITDLWTAGCEKILVLDSRLSNN